MKNKIYIEIDKDFENDINKNSIKKCALESLNIGSSNLCEDSISISIASSEKIKILNKKFLNKNSSTDVLAFPTTQNWSKGIRNSNGKDNFNDENIIELNQYGEKILESTTNEVLKLNNEI